MPKTKSKKVDIIQIEDQYNQSVAIYLKTLKNKLKSLEKWEFEKQLYQTKINALKNKNKMLKTKLQLAKKDNQKPNGCCPLFTNCTRAVPVFPSSLIEDSLSESGDSSRDSFRDSLIQEEEEDDVNDDHEDDDNDDNDDNEDNEKKLNKLKCLSIVKAGAIATGLLV